MNANLITIILCMSTGACLAIALIFFVVWLKQIGQREFLVFAVLACSVAVLLLFESLLLSARTPGEYGVLLRWLHVSNLAAVTSSLLFVWFYFKAGRLWLACCVFSLLLLDLILNFHFEPNLDYRVITGLQQIELFGGETATVAVGAANPWRWIGELNTLMLIIFLVDASLACWRRNDRSDRQRAAAIGGSFVVFGFTDVVISALGQLGIIESIHMHSILLFPPMLAICFELISDVARFEQATKLMGQKDEELLQESAFLRTVIDISPNLIFAKDRQGRFTLANKAIADIYGTNVEALIGKTDADFNHDAEAVKAYRLADLAVMDALQEKFIAEEHVMDAAGEVHWLQTVKRPILNPDGTADHVLGVCTDISELRRMRENLAFLLREMMLILNSLKEGIVGLDLQGNHTFVNTAAARMLGYEIEELLGRPSHSTWHHTKPDGSPYPVEVCNIHAAYKDGETHESSTEVFWRKDGTSFAVYYSSTPLFNQGRLAGAVVAFTDITKRIRMDDDMRQMRNELAHLSRVMMLGELSGSLAHELNQPLTAILCNAQAALRFIAQGSPDRDEVKAILEDIVVDDKRAGDIISGLRSLLKKGQTRNELLDVNDMVRSVVGLMRSDLLNGGIEISKELAAGLPKVSGDQVQLQQVIINLLMNGCDAMIANAPGERRLSITTLLAEENFILVRVTDHGHGIPAEDMERVFEPFFTTKEHGLGLGLGVCHKIISAHGGNLWATNNAGRGASFCFTLPANPEAAA